MLAVVGTVVLILAINPGFRRNVINQFGEGTEGSAKTPTVEEIVTNPDDFHSGDTPEEVESAQTLSITGVFVKQGKDGGYLVDPHTQAEDFSTPRMRVNKTVPHFPLGEYEEYRVKGKPVKLDSDSPYYSPYENMKLFISDDPFAIYPASLQEPTPIRKLAQDPTKYESKIVVVVGVYKGTGVSTGLNYVLESEGYTINFYPPSFAGNYFEGSRYLAKGRWVWVAQAETYQLDTSIGFLKRYPKPNVLVPK